MYRINGCFHLFLFQLLFGLPEGPEELGFLKLQWLCVSISPGASWGKNANLNVSIFFVFVSLESFFLGCLFNMGN